MDENEKVTSVETYLKQLPRLHEKLVGNIFYRGQSNTSYKLTPSVLRDYTILHDENKIYTQIMTECAHELEGCNLHNEILSKMQHYGVPTRLLDVTTNALVALYFACGENNDRDDGAVYVIKTSESKIKQYDSDSISILASLPRFNYVEREEISALAKKIKLEKNSDYDDRTIEEFNGNRLIRRLLHEIKKEKPAFENIINPDDLLTNYFLIPRKVNARIIRQSGAFIIFGLEDDEIIVHSNYWEYMNNHDVGSYKIIIEKDSKHTIVDQLSCFGISKATLHPELYKVAEFIKERYSIL